MGTWVKDIFRPKNREKKNVPQKTKIRKSEARLKHSVQHVATCQGESSGAARVIQPGEPSIRLCNALI